MMSNPAIVGPVIAGAMNPELERERKNATFDPEQVARILHGDSLAKQRLYEKLLAEDKDVANEPIYHFQSRPDKYSEAIRKAAIFFRLVKEHNIAREDEFLLRDLLFPNEEPPFSLNSSMFIPTLETQGSDEQKSKWLQKALNYEIIGTYAQTEMGHGTNVRQLETTATYDPNNEEFILHSPTITSTKFWPGGLGKTSNYAVVMAGLYSQNKFHGIHAFVVQLRDLKTHEPLPGITVGDIGPKFGYDNMDNGFLRFNNVRIPRENMLMRNAQIKKDGSFIRTSQNDKLGYLVMVFVRSVIIWHTAAQSLAQAVTIAVRYSCVRHQSELRPGADEPQIIEYQTQQYKLFPLLASAFAYWVTGRKMRNVYVDALQEIMKGNTDSLAELHATSAGLKAFTTSGMMYGIEQCRLACGGHGYSQASGIPKIYVSAVPACTYEGENTVLLLQTARFLAKSYREALQKGKSRGNVAYLADSLDVKSAINELLSVDSLVSAFRHRAARLVAKACTKLAQAEARGMQQYEAWNKSSIFLVRAAEAHCHFIVVQDFAESTALSKCADSTSVSAVLTDLFKLYAVNGIWSNAADFTEDGYLSSDQVRIIEDAVVSLLERIRPNAVALVDSFCFSDRYLGSVLGRYDGQVYENLYKWATSSPLNKTQAHESQRHLAHLRSQSKL